MQIQIKESLELLIFCCPLIVIQVDMYTFHHWISLDLLNQIMTFMIIQIPIKYMYLLIEQESRQVLSDINFLEHFIS